MSMDSESQKLTTFLLPYPVHGRDAYTRAPMGLHSSNDELNLRTDKIFADIPNIQKLIDDILVEADSIKQLVKTIKRVLKKCKEHDITISPSKFKIGRQVKFGGFIVSDKGVRIDPERIDAISKFPVPTDVKGVRSFMGLINQLSFHNPDINQMTPRIRELLKKDVAFLWEPEHQKEFDEVKSTLLKSGILKPYNKDLKTILITDASKIHGLGYVLLQVDGDQTNLIRCGSQSLTGAQKNYAIIELEALAIYTGIKKCAYFLRGCPQFQVRTDHKPLQYIFQKEIREIDNVRLQKYREKLMEYNFDVIYLPGKENLIADALSRYPIWEGENETKCRKATEGTVKDPQLLELMAYAKVDKDYNMIKS